MAHTPETVGSGSTKGTGSTGGSTTPSAPAPSSKKATERAGGGSSSDPKPNEGNTGGTSAPTGSDKPKGKGSDDRGGDRTDVGNNEETGGKGKDKGKDKPTKEQRANQEYRNVNGLRRNFDAFDSDGDGRVSQDEIRDGKGLKGKELRERLEDQYGALTDEQYERRSKSWTDAANYYSKDKNYADLVQGQQGEESDEVTVSDVNNRRDEAIENLTPEQQKRIEARDNRGALQVLNRDFDKFDTAGQSPWMKDGNVSEDDLRHVLENPGDYSAQQRNAAQYLLNNPDRLKALDNGDGDEVGISQSDVEGGLTRGNREVLQNSKDPKALRELRAERTRDAAGVINKDFETFAGDDGELTRDDLRSFLQDPSKGTAEQRQAARNLLQNPGVFNASDTAAHGGDTDGQISINDIQNRVTQTERDFREKYSSPKEQRQFRAQELDSLKALDRYFMGNGEDLSRSQLERLQNNGSPREQKAASFFLDNLGELYALDRAADDDRKVDDKITAEDVQRLMQQLQG